MPERKLSYKVDVDTGQAVQDLSRLGTAGADAGKDIARGFDQAESASKQALSALSAKLDQVEQDARGTAEAVAAIKAHLTVDVDDAKIGQFASDLKNKMGVAFDDVKANAKEFADVLERGVDLSKTTNEIRNVGDELDTTRGEADQSRSVLANMAGNTAQDLGQLGGVVGTLGVGIGQLAEYAVDGNIALENLASVAGPMAALTAANLLVQGISSGLADLKKRQEAYTQQQEDFNTALRESGDLQSTVNDMLTNNVELSAAPELNWWQGMMDDLPVLTGMVDEQTTAQSGLVEALAASGTSAQEFSFALDHGLGPFNALNQAWKDMLDNGQISQDQYDTLTTQLDLYSQTALKAEVQQQNLNIVFGDGTTAAAAKYAKAAGDSSELTQMWADETQALTDAAEAASAAIRDQADNARDANAIMAGADWGQASFDAATTAMGEFFAAHDAGLHSVGDLSDAYAGLHESLHAAFGEGNLPDVSSLIPDMTTPEGRAVLDALDQVGTALIPSISRAFANSHGDISKFRTDMGDLYQSTLTGLADQLGVSEDKVKALLATIGLTPDNFDTMYELNGTEDAKVKLQLLQTQIDKLPKDVQMQVQQQIIEGDWQGALATVEAGFARGAKVPMNFDTSSADKALANVQSKANNNPIKVPVYFQQQNTPTSGYSKARSTRAAPTEAVAVDTLAAAPTATVTPALSAAPIVVQTPAPSLTVNLSAGLIGNRYDLSRWVRAAIRDQQRLGRTVTVPS